MCHSRLKKDGLTEAGATGTQKLIPKELSQVLRLGRPRIWDVKDKQIDSWLRRCSENDMAPRKRETCLKEDELY